MIAEQPEVHDEDRVGQRRLEQDYRPGGERDRRSSEDERAVEGRPAKPRRGPLGSGTCYRHLLDDSLRSLRSARARVSERSVMDQFSVSDISTGHRPAGKISDFRPEDVKISQAGNLSDSGPPRVHRRSARGFSGAPVVRPRQRFPSQRYWPRLVGRQQLHTAVCTFAHLRPHGRALQGQDRASERSPRGGPQSGARYDGRSLEYRSRRACSNSNRACALMPPAIPHNEATSLVRQQDQRGNAGGALVRGGGGDSRPRSEAGPGRKALEPSAVPRRIRQSAALRSGAAHVAVRAFAVAPTEASHPRTASNARMSRTVRHSFGRPPGSSG